MDARVEISDADYLRTWQAEGFTSAYVLPADTPRTAGLTNGQRVTVYEMSNDEIVMEAEAIAIERTDRAAWEPILTGTRNGSIRTENPRLEPSS